MKSEQRKALISFKSRELPRLLWLPNNHESIDRVILFMGEKLTSITEYCIEDNYQVAKWIGKGTKTNKFEDQVPQFSLERLLCECPISEA